MQPVDADEAPEPELEWERVPSPGLAAARRDVSAPEREHVRAHLRPPPPPPPPARLQEMERLLHAVHNELAASAESALDPARSPGAEAEERVGKLCEKVEKKAVEAALVGKHTVETHQQIDSHECR
ncbi:MORF4 family associated protein 1 like 2-like [Myotis yumanensis]|uniref:MORF4 family associated protein 1 like 2-like n=1 Tax=Myotis yumanensis TaxID=159337 RepID=UPI0038D4DD01